MALELQNLLPYLIYILTFSEKSQVLSKAFILELVVEGEFLLIILRRHLKAPTLRRVKSSISMFSPRGAGDVNRRVHLALLIFGLWLF